MVCSGSKVHTTGILTVQSRPRRAAAPKANPNPNPANSAAQEDTDPDYLALSSRQKRAIDKAFEKGTTVRKGNGNKRRKAENGDGVAVKDFADVEGGDGGFLPEDDEGGGGGFLPDEDEGGGGFLPDDGSDDGGGFLPDDEGGGFLPDDDDGGFPPNTGNDDLQTKKSNRNNTSSSTKQSHPASSASTSKIPLHRLPAILSSLGLPADPDVLQVFRASASGWNDDDADIQTSYRRKKGEEEVELGVELQDFRAVCAALMGPDADLEGDGEAEEEEEEEEGEDVFNPADEDGESSLSDLSSTSSLDDPGPSKLKTKPQPKTGSSRKGKKALQSTETIKLTSRQKEAVRDIWTMLKPESNTKGRGGFVLGRDEVKALVRTQGEMWSDEEVGSPLAYLIWGNGERDNGESEGEGKG